jgi:TatD DNase family protein
MALSEKPLVDTHAHICDPVFDSDRDAVLERGKTAGVASVVAVGETLADARRNLELARMHPNLRPAAGLYPTVLDLGQAKEMENFIRSHRERLVAIGEVGLDFWAVRQDEQKALQREIFKIFINLSRELDLPLNVHSRSAGRHAVAFLLENHAELVQMHAFDGKASAALPAVEAGYFFSVPPSIVRSRQKQKLVRHLPLSCLLAETDSPVLGPEPKTRNEPANLIHSIEAIARIKAVDVEAVVEAVVENARRLYGEM